MTQSQLEQLIDRYLQGTATNQEVDMVEKFYSHMVEGVDEFENISSGDKKQMQNRIYRKIKAQISISKRSNIRYILSGAAAVLLLLISGYLYLNSLSTTESVVVIPTSEKTIDAGAEQKSILLSDGTYILLSPGATISYPVTFDDEIRKVILSGEAWFDVQRDVLHPFQVATGKVVTTVLGTSFSVNSSSGQESVEVKVTSGRVKVNSPEKELAVLEKDDQLVYRSGEVEVSRNALEEERNKAQLPQPGAFKLANVTMEEAAHFLEKRWNKEIDFENKAIEKCPLYASFNAEDSLEDVLMILCGVSNSEYKMENGKIKIYGKGCNY